MAKVFPAMLLLNEYSNTGFILIFAHGENNERFYLLMELF